MQNKNEEENEMKNIFLCYKRLLNTNYSVRLVILYVGHLNAATMFFCFLAANFGLRKTLENLNNLGIRKW